MLLDQLWPRIAELLRCGQILAAVPTRDVLAVCPADSAAGRRELTDVIDRVWSTGDHRLTRDLYRYASSGWQVTEP